ncbi:hypothetical protein [Flavobacterium johnsoniae]|uniref:Uncharacterized protein n=1 Tax=Flavobacterium johnsoniae (strain ATCC 17061 / DSM 2064 / JCM 8514 / BCRC 14874 / CCUG 350202 / NBRC 14942 / NCIMB 11054 / UW101) TaxID=376686 RepID=A5FJS3_FLAJ1|nr:hypothetical protein [Flavobacterium johnsoniae]ABQ04541.1 hypothetical protein Fjoh_1509 [Flavobacterium johnsoniae UW101]OXE97865.1 hypothetical protein B0A63_17195 [Flavobacterium johnsoniae UW101]WQG83662.1 hypothetical protein SR927_11190 [Flavobacterium johnsoniae UW101]SHK25450.1 hypothetical protein SAMN05444146_0943 [Flavobacterium johnsoniae]
MTFIDQLIKLNRGEIEVKGILLPIIVSLMLILILVHEFKNKIINIKIINDNIEKRTYLGYSKIFKFNDFNGFEIRILKGNVEDYEYLYLMKDGKPIITISQTYLENYYELKNVISNKSKYMSSSYGMLDEVKDLLTLK